MGNHRCSVVPRRSPALSPSNPQTLGENGLSWLLNCVDSTEAGDFGVCLKVPMWNAEFSQLPMSLAHNKVKITEKYGPTQESGGLGRYGVRATSTLTGLPAVDVC